MTNHRAFVKPTKENKNNFKFDQSFNETFNSMIDMYTQSLDILNEVSSGKSVDDEYGICNCSYKLRFITPNDVSTYISNLVKALENDMFHGNVADIEMFTVASVKRFIEENGCVPFEDSLLMSKDHRYVNPKEQNLHDLILICQNDVPDVAVYSRGEMVKRIKNIESDVKKINDLHFTANMKKIISSLPSIINDVESFNYGGAFYAFALTHYIQEFLLFVCTLNTIAIGEIIGYASPKVGYKTKVNNTRTEELVTECCLLKTNDFMIRNKIPFNCNIRDVILQDVTEDFSDTHNAIRFIMKDERSPISILVHKYATESPNSQIDCSLISRLFRGVPSYERENEEAYKTKIEGTHVENPREMTSFRTENGWLDNITLGNNFLDGNYRRDGVGNHRVHPILNTLDTIYKIYGGCDLKTNEELANNIIRVTAMIRSIIKGYPEYFTDNWDMVKDTLVVLGEILTRNMLKLYYNNTRVYMYDDNMPDSATPGYICMESFIMEEDTNNTNSTTPNTSNNNSGKPTVKFTNANNNEVKQSMKTKLSAVIRKFSLWITNSLSKFFTKFNENHKKEVEWVKNNMDLNKKIENAIAAEQFNPTVTNWPQFHVPADVFQQSNIAEQVQKILDDTSGKADPKELLALCAPKDESVRSQFKGKDEAQMKEMYTNYCLYHQTTKPEMYTGKLQVKQWIDLVKDLTDTMNLIEKASKTAAADMTKAVDLISKKQQQLETNANSNNTNNENNQSMADKVNELYNQLKKVSNVYETTRLNVLNSKFYATSYNLYRDIVAGYKQQFGNGEATKAEDTSNNPEAIETPDDTSTSSTDTGVSDETSAT